MTTCTFSLNVDFAGTEFDNWDTRIEVAAEPLSCYECSADIAAGEQYEFTAASVADEALEYHVCLDCAEIAKAFASDRSYGSLWEGIGDEIEEDPMALNAACFGKLKRASAKRKIQDFWIDQVL